MVDLSFQNALRASGVTGFTLENFAAATFFDGSGNYIVTITKHKISANNGALHPGHSPLMHKCLLFYVKHIRPAFAKSTVKELFVTIRGDALQSSNVSKIINDDLHKSGCEVSANNTKIRKMATTMMLSCMPGEKLPTAGFMKHGPDVQEKNYNIQQSGAQDARLANIMARMVAGEEVEEHHLYPQIKSTITFPLSEYF